MEIFGPAPGPGSTDGAADFAQYASVPVHVEGRGRPAAVADFEGLELPPSLRRNVARAGYTAPTPIQAHAIPAALASRDVLGCAQTGSGKTAAFLLPTIARLLAKGALPERARRRATPSGLVLAPTRELSAQIFAEARKFCYRTGVRPVVVYGGAPIVDQLRELERGCELLVATPGRLVDLLERCRVDVCHVEVLTLDEADRMLDMGFEPQIRAICAPRDGGMPPPGARQTLLFSATWPREIAALARDFGREYVRVTVGRVGSTTKLIRQRLVHVDGHEKQARLLELLAEPADQTAEPNAPAKTLVFVETKRAADALEGFLTARGVAAASIHGDRAQWEREDALAAFKCGRAPVLVATDVAARGLDISDVSHVINYDMPSDVDGYVHRIGRKGRAGRRGLATSFVNARTGRAVLEGVARAFEEGGSELPAFFGVLIRAAGGSGGGHRRTSGRGGWGGVGGPGRGASARDGGRGRGVAAAAWAALGARGGNNSA